MDIIPFGDKLYIKVLERATKIKNVFIPQDHKMRTEKAEVISVGEDVKYFKPGDKILVMFYSGIHVQTPETYSQAPTHRLIVEHEILAKYSD
jgi:co-chaperonin GroES (HSP10)